MSSDAERFIKSWNRIHAETSRVLRAAPDNKLDFRPKEDMFSLRELIGHIPQAEDVLARTALAGTSQKSRFDFEGRCASEITALFDAQHEELADQVSRLSSEQLNEQVEFHGRRLRRLALLWFLTEHEIHHRGQVFTYYHLAGIEPPNMHE